MQGSTTETEPIGRDERSRGAGRRRQVVRVFGHCVSVRGLALRGVETIALAGTLLVVAGPALPPEPARSELVLLYVATILVMLQFMALYERQRMPAATSFRRVALAYGLAGGALLAITWLLGIGPLALRPLALALAISFALSFAIRLLMPAVAPLLMPPIRVLVVGRDAVADEVIAILQAKDPLEGLVLAGTYDPRLERFYPAGGPPERGLATSLDALVATEPIGELVLALGDRRGLPIANLLRYKAGGLRVTDNVTFLEREKRFLAVDAMGPGALLFSAGFSRGPWRTMSKRLFDIALSAALLAAFAPTLIALVVFARLRRGSPLFDRLPRTGLGGRPIAIRRFRTGHPAIDRMAMLLNVLEGSMSFVGPQAEPEPAHRQAKGEIAHYDLRLAFVPGLTGWAQINREPHAEAEDPRMRLRYDLYYLKCQSMVLDLVILLSALRDLLLDRPAAGRGR